MRPIDGIRGHILSKSDTYTKHLSVDLTGISVKVSVHYPGRSLLLRKLFSWRHEEMMREKSAEGIVKRLVPPKA